MGIKDKCKDMYVWVNELPVGFKFIMTVHLTWIILGFCDVVDSYPFIASMVV